MPRAAEPVRQERETAWSGLYQTLKKQGRTQTWFAEQMGVSRKTLSNYLHGESRPPAWFLSRASKVLHVKRSDIAPPEPLERFVLMRVSSRRHTTQPRAARGPPAALTSSSTFPVPAGTPEPRNL